MQYTRRELRIKGILESDKQQAVADARAAVVAQSVELAPLSYAAMRAVKGTAALDALLATLPATLLRAQAVRFLVERKAATGMGWTWEDVTDVASRFARAAERAAQPAQIAA